MLQITPACAHGNCSECTCECVCHGRAALGRDQVLTRALVVLDAVGRGLSETAKERLATTSQLQWTMESMSTSLARAANDVRWQRPDWANTSEFIALAIYVADYLRPQVVAVKKKLRKAKWTDAQIRLALIEGLARALTPNDRKRYAAKAKKVTVA